MILHRVILTTVLFLIASPSYAQLREVKFRNLMQTVIDVTISPVGSSEVNRFTLDANITTFRFQSERFDIRVVPRDSPFTGFRLQNVPLAELAAGAGGEPLDIGGEFKVKRVLLRHWDCCIGEWYTEATINIRSAVTLSGRTRDGKPYLNRAPRIRYK